MVGSTTHNQHPSLQLALPSSTTSPEDDEILKRNTDCVYFLASPLTCKKGSECEYRHSDVARVNPRDCFYWLNGNCLNPKCAFRHPPLDGLVGADMSTPVGSSAPAPYPASYATPKQGVACIFFQKGFCLKGHLCPFLHGPPNLINNKPTLSVSANPISDPPKTVFPVTEKPVQDQKFTQNTPVQKAPFSAQNGVVDKKVALPPARVVPNRNNVYHGYHVSETDKTVNVKDADEYSREASPGFDVLVDNEVEDSEYPREKDEFGRLRGRDYDIDRVDRDIYRDYDRFNEREGHLDVDYDDRLERRPYSRNARENESDLRHRISKQRRGSDNGLRSVVSREYGRESHHNHRQDHRQDRRQDHGNLSSRLRGRIKIPGRSISPSNGNTARVERGVSMNQNRLRNRITDSNFSGPKRLEDLKRLQSNDEQSLGKRKYPKTEDSSSFEGPKPLSEILKRKRLVNNNNNNNDIHISANKDKDERNFVSVDIEELNENENEKEKDKPVDGNSVNYGTSEAEIEQGFIDEDALLDEEGEYEYEQMEGEEGDYDLNEGEYVEEEEDGDEYGKTDRVVYS